MHRDKALFGTDKGQHGPVRHIVKDGLPVCPLDIKVTHTITFEYTEEELHELTSQQEENEQDYTKGCPLQ